MGRLDVLLGGVVVLAMGCGSVVSSEEELTPDGGPVPEVESDGGPLATKTVSFSIPPAAPAGFAITIHVGDLSHACTLGDCNAIEVEEGADLEVEASCGAATFCKWTMENPCKDTNTNACSVSDVATDLTFGVSCGTPHCTAEPAPEEPQAS